MVEEPIDMEDEVKNALLELIDLIHNSEVIVRYQKIAKQVNTHEGLQNLTEKIKKTQQEAVNFSHYDKPNAESMAIEEINRLTKEFDEHPLVIYYRECLIEANDLIQYVTNKIERDINSEVAQIFEDQILLNKGCDHLATED